nr:heat stress transcription factor B-3-like [Ipomoea batatas]
MAITSSASSIIILEIIRSSNFTSSFCCSSSSLSFPVSAPELFELSDVSTSMISSFPSPLFDVSPVPCKSSFCSFPSLTYLSTSFIITLFMAFASTQMLLPSLKPDILVLPSLQPYLPKSLFAAMEAEQKGGIIILDLDNNPSEPSGNDSGATKEKMEAPFVRKTYDMVNNLETDSIVSWNSDGSRLVVWDVHKFAAEILPTYFRHSNPSSFFCQLNSYGFRKSDWDRWEFQHQWFQRGKKTWLNKIKRRTTRKEEIKEMLDEQNSMKMEIKHLQENQVILAKKLASIREADTLDVKGRKLFLLMAQDFLESTKGKIPVEEESPNAIQENKESNDVLARSESHTRLEKLVEEGEDIMLRIEYLLEGPADWEDYVKKLGEKGDDLKTRP